MKQYMVIGAGRFGVSVAKNLIKEGQEVMLVDGSEDVVQQLADEIENIAIVDVADEMALKNAGLRNFDVAIVAIGTDLRASIMATLIAKELGVPYVISKAKDKLQAQVLRKIGADKVVFPEVDVGEKLAKSLVFNNVDRKSTRLNSSHANISYAVFCLKKKTVTTILFSSLNIFHQPTPCYILFLYHLARYDKCDTLDDALHV